MVASLNKAIYEPARVEPNRLIRMLLVEDSKQDVYLIQQMLTHNAAGCRYAFTDVPRLVDAFRRIARQEFDVVLLDLGLLDIDGLASVKALRAEIPHTPIIVYSGQDDPKMKAQAIASGATNYLVKGRESAAALQDILLKTLAEATV